MPPDMAGLGLVLPGGGARAAYQAGVLLAVAELCPAGRSPFSVITGQSAGAINAVALASMAGNFHAGVRHLVSAWSSLSVEQVVRVDLAAMAGSALRWTLTVGSGGWLIQNPRSLLDNSPLAATLLREIDFDGIERAIAARDLDALAITASTYSDEAGQAVTFFAAREGRDDWFRTRRCGLRRRIGVEHVMASSALPFMFPAQAIDGQYYGDGALRLVAPLSPAIHLGAERLLVIAARDPDMPSELMTAASYPSLADLAGHMLDILFNDHLDSDIERLLRINSTLSLMDDPQRERTPLRPVEALVIRPSRDLREIAGRHAGELPWTLRTLLKGIGGWGGDWRLPSYLNFSAGYCSELIELGHADAMNFRKDLYDLLNRRAARNSEG